MGQAALRTGLSPQEYLAFERAAGQRHEYADGEVFAMAGGTMRHSLLAANVIGELRSALRAQPCRVFTSDMRLKIPTNDRYTYADAGVVCGRSAFEDEVEDTLLNPTVIVEVLSDSSELYDRGDKFAQYRTIASLKDYVLVSQKQPLIEHFARQPDNSWLLRLHGPGERLLFSTIQCELAVDEVYLKAFGEP
jgi:Uma2 family endonuclease